MTTTKRLIVSLSPQQKKRLAALSKSQGQSMAQLVRRALERMADPGTLDADDEGLLERRLEELNAAIDRADKAVDSARDEVARIRGSLRRTRKRGNSGARLRKAA